MTSVSIPAHLPTTNVLGSTTASVLASAPPAGAGVLEPQKPGSPENNRASDWDSLVRPSPRPCSSGPFAHAPGHCRVAPARLLLWGLSRSQESPVPLDVPPGSSWEWATWGQECLALDFLALLTSLKAQTPHCPPRVHMQGTLLPLKTSHVTARSVRT